MVHPLATLYRQVRHVLARLTHWVDTECGLPSDLEDLVSPGRTRPFEIEHIWADHYDRFADVIPQVNDFESQRNRLGGLLMLQRGVNQSLGDATYEDKRDAYVAHSENLLARSLHPLAYSNNPGFAALRERTGLPFRPHDSFGPEDQAARQELYIRIAEWIWNPSRLDLDGANPPVPEPIGDPEEGNSEGDDRPDRYEARVAFWTALLLRAKERSDLHARISPNRYHWAGTRRHGQWWNYVALQGETRAELYIDGPHASDNKALYDALAAQRAGVESEFGGELSWRRMDDRRASRISYSVPGGWADEATWPSAIEKAVDAMQRLYKALGPRVQAVGD